MHEHDEAAQLDEMLSCGEDCGDDVALTARRTMVAASWLRPIARECWQNGTLSAEVMGWLLQVETKMAILAGEAQ